MFSGYYETCGVFEGVVCIGSTAKLPLVVLQYRQYAFFQVARLFRLPMLLVSARSFVKRVFGSSKKIQQFAIFTVVVLVISAGMFLQVSFYLFHIFETLLGWMHLVLVFVC